MILDACFLIDLLAKDKGAIVKLDEISNQLLAVPTLVYTKVGVGINPETAQARRFEEVMDQMTLVSYDTETAHRAVDIQRTLLSQGKPISAVNRLGVKPRGTRPAPPVVPSMSLGYR